MKIIENIVLIGFMGTGKSTVGKRLAKLLAWDFIDTDAEIERITGMSIPEIFRRHGEKRFRSEESLVVKRLAGKKQCVISTGGGTVINPENWEILCRLGVVITLDASSEIILVRVGHRLDRPLLKDSPEEIEALRQERQPYYNRADYIIDTTTKNIEEVIKEILTKLNLASILEEVTEIGSMAED